MTDFHDFFKNYVCRKFSPHKSWIAHFTELKTENIFEDGLLGLKLCARPWKCIAVSEVNWDEIDRSIKDQQF
jgi:hypothetical protein